MTFINCTSKRTGDPLTTYFTKNEAIDAADYVLQAYQNAMIPYNCKNCGHWHLCPEDRFTPNQTCTFCTDSNNKPKQLYLSYQSALKRAKCIYKERNERLNVYECCHNHGWHLTKADRW